MDEIHTIVIHHSASPRESTHFDDIRRWHTDPDRPGGPFDDIGYHFVIEADGSIWHGRELPTKGAHATPNEGRIGICITGDNTQRGEEWNLEQVLNARLLISNLSAIWPNARISSHRELKGHKHNKCPGVDIYELLQRPKDLH